MTDKTPERQMDRQTLEEDFELAFKLVFFDKNDRPQEPAQYKSLSTFSVQRDVWRKQ